MCAIITITLIFWSVLMKGRRTLLCNFMKIIVDDKVKNITAILLLTFVCEIMFNINNRIIQTLGMFLLPMIIIYGILLFKNEKK